MKRLVLGCLAGVLMAAFLGGCGSGTDPYTMFSNSPGTPTIGFPVDDGLILNITGSGTDDVLDVTLSALGQTLDSPFDGFVSSIETDSAANLYRVTLYYNAEFSLRLGGISLVSVREGERVLKNQSVAVLTSESNFTFTVLRNGTVTCPVSYLSENAQAVAQSKSPLGVIPCL